MPVNKPANDNPKSNVSRIRSKRARRRRPLFSVGWRAQDIDYPGDPANSDSLFREHRTLSVHGLNEIAKRIVAEEKAKVRARLRIVR
jgi:hypothetical protein